MFHYQTVEELRQAAQEDGVTLPLGGDLSPLGQEREVLGVNLPTRVAIQPTEGCAGTAGGQTVGYVFETEASGYGGTVSVMTGIDAEGNITGVVLLSHDETPGLGANAEKPDFLNQYLQPAPEGGLSVIKYQAPSQGQIEAITGATGTSTAVTNAVNQAIEQYYEVKGVERPRKRSTACTTSSPRVSSKKTPCCAWCWAAAPLWR